MPQQEVIIQGLSDNTINQIAAGEVIQNYSSMLKELIENAIDAKSSNIFIYFVGQDLESIQIIDDGIGMHKSNLELCYKRYFTSKISQIQDLQVIQTMGFRGEALSSIASVSQLTIETRHNSQDYAHKLQINYGRVEEILPSHRQQGTTITIRNLFKNLPVRKKFLSAPSTELKKCLKVIETMSFSHLNISFKAFQDKKNILTLTSPKLENRLKNILTVNFHNLISVDQVQDHYQLKGFIGSFETQKSNQTNQYFYVNQRVISSNLISKSFRNAYFSSNQMKFPIGILFLTCPAHLIDVNVHPSKKEVKFLEPKEISDFIENSIQKSLTKNLKIPQFKIEKQESKFLVDSNIQFETIPIFQKTTNPSQRDSFQKEISLSSNTILKKPKEKTSLGNALPNFKKPPFSYLYLNQKLILLEIEGALAIVHQKRAHERILYEQALESLKNKSVSTQQLLFPELLDLNKTETEILLLNLKNLGFLGFDITEFGPLSFQIKGIPIQIQQKSAIDLLKKMIQDFDSNNKKQQNTFVILAQIYAKHASISNQKILNHEEIIHLIDHLFSTQNPFVSPQGKQTILRYNLDEIEHRFKS